MGHRQRMGVGPAEVAVEGQLEVVRRGPGAGQRHRQDGVGAQPALVGRPVEVDQARSTARWSSASMPQHRGGDLPVDVGHRLEHALAAVPVAAVAQLDRLVDAGRRPGRHDGTPGRRSRAPPPPRRSGCRGSRGPRARSTCSMVLTTSLLGCPCPGGTPGHKASGCQSPGRGRLRRARMSAERRCARSRSACSASTPRRCARFATAKSSSPTCSCSSVRLAGQRIVGGRQRRRRPAAPAPPAPPRPHPGAGGLRLHADRSAPCAASLVVSMSAGSAAGMPSVTLRRPFSLFLIASQFDTTWSALAASTSPKTWGWRCTSLSWTPRATSGQVEPPLLVGQAGVEHDLEQQVAQLLLAGAPDGASPVPSSADERRRGPRSTPRRDAASTTHGSAPGPRGTRSRSVSMSATSRAISSPDGPRRRPGDAGT